MTSPRRLSTQRLVEMIGEPSPVVAAKIRPRLGHNAKLFISRSPLLVLATSNAAGELDCSPRGDPPGFVKVLDDTTLAIPDRPGNRLAQSFKNIVEREGVGMLFLIPGAPESLRANGRAYLTDEPDLLAGMAVNGRRPKLATIIVVDEAYIHCGRALLRSRAWEPDAQGLAEGLPSVGAFLAEAAPGEGRSDDTNQPTVEEIDADTALAYRQLYGGSGRD